MTDARKVVTVSAYLPGRPGPGQLRSVPLEVLSRGPAELALPEVTVRDERGVALLDPGSTGDLLADPAGGGGPRCEADQDRSARLFGLTNVAYNAQRMLRAVNSLLGRPLPHLLIRIGMHEESRGWQGGHYRVSARSYDPPELGHPLATGEIHLGGGHGYVPRVDAEPYFSAPSHNLAIVYHEIGHHVCRHTADFRLNRLRPVTQQTNKKIPLDEGTCDLLTAVMLDDPDIYGWHRSAIPSWNRRRRELNPRWTMALFVGGQSDPHTDGTIWASACWAAREQVASAGHDRARFDRMLLRGLELSAEINSVEHRDISGAEELTKLSLKHRRYISRLLEAMLLADPELSGPVLAAMSLHGVRPGASNDHLRDTAYPAHPGTARAQA